MGSDPHISIPPVWVPPQGCFGGPSAAEWVQRSCHPACDLPLGNGFEIQVKEGNSKETTQSPTSGSCFGVPSLAVGIGVRSKPHLGAGFRLPAGLFWEGGAGGARCPLRVWGIFGGVPMGPFSRPLPLWAEPAAAGSGCPWQQHRCSWEALGHLKAGFWGAGMGVRLSPRGEHPPVLGTAPFLKVSGVGSAAEAVGLFQ